MLIILRQNINSRPPDGVAGRDAAFVRRRAAVASEGYANWSGIIRGSLRSTSQRLHSTLPALRVRHGESALWEARTGKAFCVVPGERCRVDVGASYPQLRVASPCKGQLKTTCPALSAERLLATSVARVLRHDRPAATSCSAHRTWQVVFSCSSLPYSCSSLPYSCSSLPYSCSSLPYSIVASTPR
jgi:hypothetical protein